MSESKIVLAIRKFQLDYAWDKSLMVSDDISAKTRNAAPDKHSATYLEDFIASEQLRTGGPQKKPHPGIEI